MSSDEAADNAEDPGHRSFIMRATETFDGQERVMSRAAYDLQVLATAHSASCGHPGFVPDDYLEHLDGLAIETTIAAAELCTIGMWERVDGGYRVLDWEAVEICLDQVRQRWGEDQQALAWEREREALVRGTDSAQGGGYHVDPVYDSASSEDLAGRLYGLVISFSDRLPADQAQWLHHVVEVGEYGLALEDLAAMLAYDKIVVTDQERGDIVTLARQMGMDLGSNWTGPTEEP
jgi:hypothetical protein